MRVALAYTEDSIWRNRDTFVRGRAEIVAFLTAKWERELEYALAQEPWCFEDNRIAVRFQYECHDAEGQWWRSYGNELWEFDQHGLMTRREASINDVPIAEHDRRIFGPRTGADTTITAAVAPAADRRQPLERIRQDQRSSRPALHGSVCTTTSAISGICWRRTSSSSLARW